jgi:flagellar biosynthetic protein FliR
MSRVSGLVLSMPLLNSAVIPRLVKAVVIVMITAVLAPVLPRFSSELSLGILLISISSEFMLGVLMGGALTLVFTTVSVASAMISTQIGQAAAMAFNPTMTAQTSPVGTIATFMALSVWLGANGHLDLLRLLAASFEVVPLDQIVTPFAGAVLWVEYSSNIFLIGLRMAGPLITLVLMINTFIALLSKMAPTMNMFFSVGFIITMFVGMILFIFMLPNILIVNQNLMDQAIKDLPRLFEMVRGD